jgi:hypothetical protein
MNLYISFFGRQIILQRKTTKFGQEREGYRLIALHGGTKNATN